MKDVLVIVPFPMSEENLAQRRAQLDAVELSDQLRFTFKSTKAAPRNYVSKADICLLYTSPSPRDKRQSRMPSSA